MFQHQGATFTLFTKNKQPYVQHIIQMPVDVQHIIQLPVDMSNT